MKDEVCEMWEAVGAIGTLLGVIVSLIVIYYAVKRDRADVTVKTTSEFYANDFPPMDGRRLGARLFYVRAINSGYTPVRITKLGIRLPRKKFRYFLPNPQQLPQTLMPAEEVELWESEAELKDQGIAQSGIGIAVDSTGRVYYERMGLLPRIKRAYWWHFGKVSGKNQ